MAITPQPDFTDFPIPAATPDLSVIPDASNGSRIAFSQVEKSKLANVEANANNYSPNFGTGAGTTCEGNDARLSDNRDPNAHSHTSAEVTVRVQQDGIGGTEQSTLNFTGGGATVTGGTISIPGNIIQNLSLGTITATTVEVALSAGTNAVLPAATVSNAGVFQATDKVKLNGIEANANNYSPTFGSTSGTTCEGDDSRLSDARAPTAHTHDSSEVTVLIQEDGAGGTEQSTINFTGAGVSVAGGTITIPGGGAGSTQDLGLGAVTLTTVEVTITDGSNVTLPAATGAAAGMFTAANSAKLAGIDNNANNYSPTFGSTGGTTCEGNDSRLSDARTPTAHSHDSSEVTILIQDEGAGGTEQSTLNFTGAGVSVTGGTITIPGGSGGSNQDLSLGTVTGTTVEIAISDGTNVTLPAATGTDAGVFTASEQTKLAGIEDNANNFNLDPSPLSTQGSTDYTLLAADNVNGQAGSIVIFTGSSNTLTLDSAQIGGTHDPSDPKVFVILNNGNAGQTVALATTGITLITPPGTSSAIDEKGSIVLTEVGTDTYMANGLLVTT